eukprot:RCo038013
MGLGVHSYVSGALFAIAWWIFVDGKVTSSVKYEFVMWLPGLLGTLGFVMINMTKPSDFNSESSVFSQDTSVNAKVWFFFSILVSFVSIIAGIWIQVDKDDGSGNQWAGVSLIFQTMFLLLSSLTFWFGRAEPSDA